MTDSHPTSCLTSLFEGNLPALAQQLSQRSFDLTRESPERLELLQLLVRGPSGPPPDFVQFHHRFLANRDCEAAAAVVGLSIAAVFDSGRDLGRLDHWYEEIPKLLAETRLSAQARAFLLFQQALVEMIRHGDPTRAAATFQRQRRAAEQAMSSSLQLLGAAWHTYCFTWSGDLAQAEIILKDAAPLLKTAGTAPAALFQYQTSAGLISALCGDAAAGVEKLLELSQHPAFTAIPPPMQLLLLGHLLDARIIAGDLDNLERTAERIRNLAIPADNDFHRSYLHFALGMAALNLGRPHKALRHSEEAELRADLSQSPIPIRMGALLRGLALTNLDHRHDALTHLKKWVKRWQECDFHLPAALGYLEISALHAASGDLDQARQAWHQAHARLPAGEKMPHLYRPQSYYEKLADQLFPQKRVFLPTSGDYAVTITTLGDFFMEINGKPISARDWRGRQSLKLLFAMIVHGGQNVSREQLAALLWPDSDGDLADNSLNVTLSRLRRVGYDNGQKPPSWLVSKNCRLWLATDLCRVDALEFRDNLTGMLKQPGENNDLGKLLDTYTGAFLPTISGLLWVDKFRDELRQLYVRGVLRRVDELQTENQGESALELLEKASGHAPIHEEIWAQRMQICIDNGETAQALNAYQQAAANLAAGMNLEPGARLKELARIASRRPTRKPRTR